MEVRFDDDVDCLIWTRDELDAILLSADTFTKGKNEKGSTPIRMAQELKANGGHVLTLGGGPQQGVWRIVAKILFHREAWMEFFATGPGKFHVGTLNPESVTARRPDELPKGMARVLVTQGSEYLAHKEQTKREPPNENLKRPPRQPRPETAGARLEEACGGEGR